ncbi:DUF373 family protein [Candidatus Bathycorpusculum sp.]|uniref:DUF373 family protein n=1 Tax=Candidatus Bathycorpusculum sp. TaxID=2994959 RepID=UPI0028337912|nr:DUF373 family protein [Candidatus Termitimicrobium sp.]MCL2432775.1 DUF373 family protein [Candidatus Termitimicrobium sp.]
MLELSVSMAKRELNQEAQKRILILCVDRDGDLEVKAKVKTPLLGRTANLNGAVALALSDPEEPDANAMFEAVRLYDQLTSESQPKGVVDVATISGSDLGGVNADLKLATELDNLMGTFHADEIVLVSDGYSDEAVLPLVSSRVKVSSMRRIVIKHSESIEETAAVFTKYIRLLVDNPRYARVALGLPGILVLVFGVLWAINIFIPDAIYWYGIIIVIIVGGFLLLKGFGVDRSTKNFYRWARDYTPPPLPIQISNYTVVSGILCIVVSIYLGVANAVSVPFPVDPNLWLSIIPQMASSFIRGIETLLIVGVCIVLLGRCVRLYIERDSRLLRNSVFIVTAAWFWWILNATANLLWNYTESSVSIASFSNIFFGQFIFTIVVGILIGIASILLIYIISHSVKGFFIKGIEEEENEEKKEKDGGSGKE